MFKQGRAKKSKGFHGGSACAEHLTCLETLDQLVRHVEDRYGADLALPSRRKAVELSGTLYRIYLRARQLVRDD